MYLLSAAKVFGQWAVDLAEAWDSTHGGELRETVDLVIKGVSEYTSHPDIEVQERVRKRLTEGATSLT